MLYDYRSVTAQRVTADTEAAIADADELVAAAIASRAAPSFDATLLPLELAGARLVEAYGRGAFMGQAHPEAAVRDAGNAAAERLNKWRVAVVVNRPLFEAVRAYAETDDARALDGERARLLAHWLRDFRRAGHELSEEARSQLAEMRNRLVEIEVAFQRNVNDYRDGIEVTREELAGLPDAYVERLSPGERPGTYRVSLDYPEVNPYLEQAHDRSRRRELFGKHWSRAVASNRPLLDEALDLRRRLAALVGSPSWAHFAMEVKMARDPERVAAFYDQIVPSVRTAVPGELEVLAAKLNADGHPDQIQPWDWRYYDDQLRRTEYGVDTDRVSEYFPLERVMDGMFELTGDVFGLDYRVVDQTEAWDPSVRLYEILDRATGEHIAHFYADLHPREGKFNHAAAFPLVIGHRARDGSYVPPVTAILANFTPASGDRPALLRHSEVETLFHEFGHVLHMSLTRAEFARFSGAETEWDFVEAPSQIMEHWTWEPSVLGRFARHYETGEAIPEDLVAAMRRARWVDIGLYVATQVFYGSIDLALHSATDPPDIERALRESYTVTGMPYPDGTFFLTGFGHLLGGYDAGYYGYLWAEVIGDDMFGRFAREGVTSSAVGAEYRRTILEPNGTLDGDDLVRGFLGRGPSVEAYLELRGMGRPAGA